MWRPATLFVVILFLIPGTQGTSGQQEPSRSRESRALRMKRVLDAVATVNSIGQKSEMSGKRVSDKELEVITKTLFTVQEIHDRISMTRIFKTMIGGDAESKDYDVPLEWAYWSSVKLLAQDPGNAARDALSEFSKGTDGGESLNIHYYQRLQRLASKEHSKNSHLAVKSLHLE